MATRTQAAIPTRPLPLSSLARAPAGALILLLAAGLRFYHLSGQSLWADEGNSVALARRSFAEIARRTAFDIHPPLYYWLLKIWVFIFGESEIGLRSLSVVLGILLVYLIWVLGERLFRQPIALIAAFIAALSPLQIYYSQEVRMYILLAVLSSLTVLTALHIFKDYSTDKRHLGAGLIYVLTITAGLYTHYAYPLIFLTVNLAALIYFWQSRHTHPPQLTIQNSKLKTHHSSFLIPHSSLIHWLTLQIIPLLLYLPWLPTAWRQLTTWPSTEQAGLWLTRLETISTTLLFGHSWPFEAGILALSIVGLTLLATVWLSLTKNLDSLAAPRASLFASPLLSISLLWFWFLLPVLLTAILFSPAFLKFLLIASPPLALMLALVIEWLTGSISYPRKIANQKTSSASPQPPHPTVAGYLVGGALLATVVAGSIIALYHYYTNPRYARDDYRAIVNFIQAVGGPADAVILNAEGQQDVFNYYYERASTPEAPVFPLPRQRPLAEVATVTELAQIEARGGNVYAVYWATQQADPNGLIEGWLNSHLYKATDQWYGNVRLVSYATPISNSKLAFTPVETQLGEQIRLTGYALSTPEIAPGDILQVALTWATGSPLPENYIVFVQLLDPANHLVGQRDAQPLPPTTAWPPGEPVVDRHGVFIEPGTPPGRHRLIVGLYHSETGHRLPVFSGDTTGGESSGDFIELAEVAVVHPATPLPPEAFRVQTWLNAPMQEELTLLGYDLSKLGHHANPDTPLRPGDPLHLVVYWQVNRPISRLEDDLIIQVVRASDNEALLSFSRPAAGTAYPITSWQPGEIVRAQYDLGLNDLAPGVYRLALTLGVQQNGGQPVTVFTRPFRVE